MSLEALKEALPDYAKDIKLNLSTLAADPSLTDEQRAGCFVASAIAARNKQVVEALMTEFGPQLSPEAYTAAKAAAAIMAMNNIYYRFTHLSSNQEYSKMPAKLRMNIIANPGVEKTTFELWSLAVSAINGCGMCIDSHEKIVREHLTAEQVQAAVKIAAVVHAAATIMDAEVTGATGEMTEAA